MLNIYLYSLNIRSEIWRIPLKENVCMKCINIISFHRERRNQRDSAILEGEEDDPQKVKTKMGHINKEMPSKPGENSLCCCYVTTGILTL